MLSVKDKVVLITGASSGIGEATARLLGEQGAHVLLGARRTERLETLVEEIRHKGGSAEFRALDVRDAKAVEDFVSYANQWFGRVDVLFNNAGIMPLSRMAELKVSDWNNMVDINIKGVLHGIAAALPIMESQGSGHIINTASVGAHLVAPTAAVYCATKYAVWAISDGLRQESKNIRVTTVSPGVVETELGHDISDEESKSFLSALRENALSPDAIANAVLYAISQPENVDVNEIIVRPTSSDF